MLSELRAKMLFESALKRKWSRYFYFDDRRRQMIGESRQHYRRRLLAEGWISDKVKSLWTATKETAAQAGIEMLDGAAWLAGKAIKLGKRAGAIVKKYAESLGGMIISGIKLLPGGEVVLEFLTEIGRDLANRFQEMRQAIGEKINEWMGSVKKKLVDMFFKYVLKDDSQKKDFYQALGIQEDAVSAVRNECYRRNVSTIRELNSHIGRRTSFLNEEASLSAAATKSIEGKLKVPGEDVLKVLGFMETKAGDDINPEDVLRGKAADIFETLINFWLKLVESNPKKYHKPFYWSGFFDVFGETGYGLASASMLGILAASELKWGDLTTYVSSMVRGFKSGSGRPEGSKTSRAGAFLFLGNEGNNYNAELFKSFITGIIKGSNIEVMTRALVGDASKIPELVKRIMKTIVAALKSAALKPVAKAIVKQTGDDEKEKQAELGEKTEGVEDEVTGVLENYIDDMFPS
jgi:hypothetical protein